MEAFFHQAVYTVVLRPYVFAFLLVYLFGCSLHLGVKRALAFCIAGYLIAWASEYSSIHNGIPYGPYYYIEETKGKELWVLGVPFMDSLSYVFLAYASYSVALMVTSPATARGKILYLLETKKIRRSLSTRIFAAFFFVYLDIIIDPVALLGDRWFLGRIYGYPEGGVYFGIPISNFIGWLIVGFVMIYALQKIDRLLDGTPDRSGYKYAWRYLIGPGLYLGVMAFNLAVTFSIGEYRLGWTGLFIVLLPALLLFSLMKLKLAADGAGRAVEAHLLDFPKAVLPGSAHSASGPPV
ncbi:MAG: carotenoid biosynthesis protein [Nitrospirae bacterium]|nr:carotenoid biosynthesis protein [Nitrospirota bacterium]